MASYGARAEFWLGHGLAGIAVGATLAIVAIGFDSAAVWHASLVVMTAAWLCGRRGVQVANKR